MLFAAVPVKSRLSSYRDICWFFFVWLFSFASLGNIKLCVCVLLLFTIFLKYYCTFLLFFLLRLRIFSLIHFSFIIISHWFTWYNVYLRGTCAVLPFKTDISVRSGSSGVFFLMLNQGDFFSVDKLFHTLRVFSLVASRNCFLLCFLNKEQVLCLYVFFFVE